MSTAPTNSPDTRSSDAESEGNEKPAAHRFDPQGNEPISVVGLGGESRFVDVYVRPAQDAPTSHYYFLVLFDEHSTSETTIKPLATHEAMSRHPEEELRQMREQLNQTIEQYEARSLQLLGPKSSRR